MKVLVTVMPKPEVSDPQGETILDAAHSLGFSEVTGLRAGKSFVLEVPAGTPLERIRALGDQLLTNPIVETFTTEVLG